MFTASSGEDTATHWMKWIRFSGFCQYKIYNVLTPLRWCSLDQVMSEHDKFRLELSVFPNGTIINSLPKQSSHTRTVTDLNKVSSISAELTSKRIFRASQNASVCLVSWRSLLIKQKYFERKYINNRGSTMFRSCISWINNTKMGLFCEAARAK